MFYDSQQEKSMEQQQFLHYQPPNQNSRKQNKNWKHLKDQCEKIQQMIVNKKILQKSQTIVKFIATNLSSNKSQIVSVQLKRNQVDQLPKLTSNIEKLLSKEKRHICYSDNIIVGTIQDKQVRDIILRMHTKFYQQKDYQKIIFIVTKITDLHKNNLYIFEKAFEDKKFIIVIPTFADIDSYVSDRGVQSEIEISYYDLFVDQDLFVEFMIESIANKQIKAYLPKQVTLLISDYDYYPLSYREGVRRLVFCIEHLFLTLGQERVFVNFKQITDIIQKTITQIHFNNNVISTKSKQKLINCILDEKSTYSIEDSIISLKTQFQTNLTPENVLENIRETIIKKLNKKQQYQIYVEILQQQDIKINKRKSNSKKYKQKNQKSLINKSQYELKKSILEDQLTLIIHTVTQKIRSQASKISWKQINLQNRICPQIPRIIVQRIQNLSQSHRKLKQIFTSCYSITLQQVVYLYGLKNKQQGELMYLIRDFQICGIIDRNKKTSKITFLNNYFLKGRFQP